MMKSAAGVVLVFGLVFGGVLASAQQGKLSDPEFSKLAASAKSAQDHTRLAAHYNAHATEHEADAKQHEALAAQYEKTEPALAGEAKHYAAHSREAAEALRSLAKLHENMTKGGK